MTTGVPGPDDGNRTACAILYIEDDIVDELALVRTVEDQHLPYQVTIARSVAEARTALVDRAFDLVLADYNFRDGTAFDLLGVLARQVVIFVTGSGDEEIAARALRMGVQDYLIKDPGRGYLKLLPWRVETALRQTRGEAELRRAKELLDRTGELARIGGWEVDLATMKLTWTQETFRIAEIDPPVEPPLEDGINLFAPEARPIIAAAVQAASDSGTPYDLELPIITAKGRHRWVHTQGFAEQRDGKPFRLFGTFQDITDRKQAEAALQASEGRLGALVDASPVPMALNDGPRIVFLNRAFVQTFGYDEQDIPTLSDWWPQGYPDPGYRQWLIDAWEQRLDLSRRTGKPFEPLELTIRCKDGRDEIAVVSAAPLADAFQGVHLVVLFPITARKQSEDALRASDQRLRDLVQSTDGIVWEADATTFQCTSVSDHAERLLGYPVAAWLEPGFWASHIHADDRDNAVSYCATCASRLKNHEFEYRFLARDGQIRWLRDIVRVVAENGKPRWLRGLMVDITAAKQADLERGSLENRLAQAQKMEAIGRLAGGVAHDFNNMLAIILGHSEIALRRTDPGDSLYADLTEVQAAAQRSAVLTGQLLAFARQQAVVPRVVVVDAAIAEALSMVRRLIGEDITVDWKPGATWPIWMDPSQLDQILTNLCINARDAIGGVGTVTIVTRDRSIDANYGATHPTALAGDYLSITVTDTGHGMDRATIANIFEPFFTTKSIGMGTGLGLATVDGAVRQNGGFITVSSEVGRGSSFEIFLPRYLGSSDRPEPGLPDPDLPPPAGRTVMVVEDEPGILRLTTLMLHGQGYNVLVAGGPEDAIRIAAAHDSPIDLLLTDVIMPAMNGQDLAHALMEQSPNLKVLFMSGYTADVISKRGVMPTGVHFLQKPFLKKALTAAVRSALVS